jgi:hypothetical protein
MPTIRYHLGEDKTPLVEIDWNAQAKDMPVRARGAAVGVIASREELLAGRRFDLPGGEELIIRQPRGMLALPEVTLGGQRLYPPQASPQARVRRASTVILIIGAAQAFLGLRPLLDGVAADQLPSMNWLATASGAVLLVLGGLARLWSLPALAVAFAVLVASWAFGIYAAVARAREHGVPFVFVVGLAFQLILLLVVYQGVGAVREMRHR